MDEEKLLAAGRIAAQAHSLGKKILKPGVKLLEVTTQIEQCIENAGGKLAFPVNISFNDTAAHYSAHPEDKTIIEDQLVKLDIGVHVDGWVTDTAVTHDLSGRYSDLVKASKEALAQVIKIVRPGITIGEIGKTIQETIEGFGYKPIRNLSGHGVGQYIVHTGLSVPNYDTRDDTEIPEGYLFACEPFATDGAGFVEEKGEPAIYSIPQYTSQRIGFMRDISKFLESNYKQLPFSKRPILQCFSPSQINYVLTQLERLDRLRKYPPLVERQGGMVSQAEHTILLKDKPVVLTKRDDE